MKNNKMTGVILAGGNNSRFGSEKGLVMLNGARNIERIIAVMNDVFTENIIIANKESLYKEFKLKVFPDLIKGKGPLMGIYTALSHSSGDVFVTACDMPFVDSNVVEKIVSSLGEFDAAIPKYKGKLHFLHAVYSKSCFEILKKHIEDGEGSPGLKHIVKEMNCNIIEDFDFRDEMISPFFNMNTPDDFALAENHLK